MGTSIAAGTGRAVVVVTAMRTELGRIASLIEEAGGDDETPLQRKLDSFGRILVWAALGIVALLFGIALLRGTELLELLKTSVGLALAAVPEGLPAVVTVALSLGVLSMARRRALMRKLSTVETLGSTSVICTDKTGTLTVVVNDATAIKGADIGIAMGKTGTEVTKQAADMVITDDNFGTIVIAVEEGRGIYDNIRNTLQYLLAGNTGELLLITICVVVGVPMPLLPIHLLRINLVTDGAPALCLANDPIDSDVMKRAPRRPSERSTNHGFLWTMAFTGFLMAGVAFAVYLDVLRTGSIETARTSAFSVLVFAQLLRSFGARSETKAVWRVSLLSNVSLVGVVAVSFRLQVWSQHNATLGRFLKTSWISLTDCLVLVAIGAIPLRILELLKMGRRRGQRRTESLGYATAT